MCAGAAVLARIDRLVYGCDDPKAGAVRSLYQIADDARLNHRIDVTGDVLAEECAALLRDFFERRRTKGTDAAAE
jgi:tRNA(adenine34) deaminase